jgi:hypothetical protein
MTDRKALHAYLSDEAHAQWHAYAERHAVSVSALIEAMAQRLPEDGNLIATAQQIDVNRRRRRKNRPQAY